MSLAVSNSVFFVSLMQSVNGAQFLNIIINSLFALFGIADVPVLVVSL